MRYKKLLEVKEDSERIYFSFFEDVNFQKIVGIPKKESQNQEIYAGLSYQSLKIVDREKSKFIIGEFMKRAISAHPAIQLCNESAIKLIS